MADPGYRWSDGHPQRRAAYAARMAQGETYQCGCHGDCHEHTSQCQVWIGHGDTWQLGHGLALKHGGDGTDSTPWCQPCNSKAAAWMTNHPHNASRDWHTLERWG